MKKLRRLITVLLTLVLLTGEFGSAGFVFEAYAAGEDGVNDVDDEKTVDEEDNSETVSEDSPSGNKMDKDSSVSTNASVSENAAEDVEEDEKEVSENESEEDVDADEYELHEQGRVVKDGKVYDESSDACLGTFDSESGLLILRKELETIPSGVFNGWDDLKIISFEEGSKAKTIGLSSGETFSGCKNLEEVDMSNCNILTTIKTKSFYNCVALNKVTFNSGLNFIEAEAFRNCKSLEEITLPENFKKLSNNAFSDCNNLQRIVIKSDAIECENNGAFRNCAISSCEFDVEGTETIVFPAYLFINAKFRDDAEIIIDEKVAEIGTAAFKNSNLPHVRILPDGKLKAIDNDAFYACKNLAEMDFSPCTELQTIGANAFYGCAELKTLSFRKCNKLTTFGNAVFKGCSGLISVEMPVSATGSDRKELGSSIFENCSALEEVKFPYAQEYIAPSEFKGCSNLSKIAFTSDYDAEFDDDNIGVLITGECVKEIGASAFSGCNSLTEVMISGALALLGNSTFESCTGLKKVTFPASSKAPEGNETEYFTRIPNSCFKNCTSLTEAVLIEGITEIGDSAFFNCNCYSSELPESLVHIGGSAFYMCSFSGTLILPPNLNYIGKAAFMCCEDQTGANNYIKLRKVIIKPLDIKTCGEEIFRECYLEEFELAPGVVRVPANLFNKATWKTGTPVRIPATVEEIGNGAFAGDKTGNVGNIKEIIFESGSRLKVIEDGAFKCNTAVGSIELPETLDSIGANAFADCLALKGIVIPENVTYIGTGAFSNCALLETLEFNAIKAEKNGKTFGRNIFEKCNIKTVIIGEGVTVFPDYLLFGAQFQKNEYGQYAFHELRLPASVTKIGQYSLTNVENIDTVVFEDNSKLTEIGQYAMKGCIGLTSINLMAAAGLIEIGQFAFSECSALKKIGLPASLLKINNSAFSKCYALESALLPESLTTLGAGVFSECKNITEMVIPSKITVIDRELCNGCEALNKLTFTGEKVTSIGNAAFMNCKELKEVSLPKSITKIDTNAFKGCPLSGTIRLVEGFTNLGSQAFESVGCAGKAEVYLPASLSNINPGAFNVTYKDNIEFFVPAGSKAEQWLIDNGFGDRLACAVTFDMLGHGEQIDTVKVLKGQSIEKPADPAEDGWIFGGWFTNKRCSSKYNFTAPVTESITLYAKWTGVERKVSFDMNGKEVKEPVEAQIVENGKTAKKPSKDPEAEGFKFTGWYTAGSCEEDELYDFNTPVMADITLYAGWSEAVRYKVTFDMNGKTGVSDAPSEQFVNEGECAVRPEKDPSLEGFKFGGWYKDEDCTSIFDFSAKISADTVIYAGWIKESADEFIVKFDLNGKPGTAPKTQTVKKGETAARPETDPEAEGYAFTGWYTEKECINEYDFTTVLTEDLTLYAGWNELNKYTVTFDMNGKVGVADAPEDQIVEEGKKVSRPQKDPSLEGFKFGGWFKEAACINVFDFSSVIDSNITIYAKWIDETVETYTVTFDLNGKSGIAPETQVIETGMKATRPENDPAAEGYTFTGWFKEKECENLYDFDEAVTENIVLYAGWKEAGSEDPDEMKTAMDPKPDISDNTTALYLVKGQKFTLGTDWVSSDKKTLSISKKGVATAKKVTAAPVKIKKGSQEIDVYIIKPEIQKSMTFFAGGSGNIALFYDAENMPVYWYSASPDVATVDQNGHVTAVAKGSAKITAYINGTAYTCKVKVKENAASLQYTAHLIPGQSKSIKLKGVSGYVWKSDDNNTVTVNKNKFTAKNPGHAVVTASVQGRTYTVDVYVEDITVSIKGIQSKGKNKYSLDTVSNSELEVSVKEVYQPVVFKSSKPEVAYIDEYGRLITGGAGKAKLTSKINGKTITITVTVR